MIIYFYYDNIIKNIKNGKKWKINKKLSKNICITKNNGSFC